MREQENTRTLPGVLATISAGFDVITKHVWLLLIPILLDVFYWLGPRLRFQTLIEQFLEVLPAEAGQFDLAAQIASIGPQTNLFTTLTVQLIGVPALMVGLAPETTPVTTQVIELKSWTTWFGLFLIFTIFGLLLTAIYYTLIASVIGKGSASRELSSASQWLRRVASSWLRLISLLLLFLLIVMILYIPLIIIGSLLFMINTTLGSIALLIGPFVMMWVILVLSLAPFGIVLNGRPVSRAIVESVRLVQTHLPSLIYLLFSVLITGAILDWILLAVENGTWLSMINIIGHAFVSTALVAAVFIYYRDRYELMFDSNSSHEIQSIARNDH
jgi:hypothetical protein